MSDDDDSKEAASRALLQRLYQRREQMLDNNADDAFDNGNSQIMSELRTVFAQMRAATDEDPPTRGMELLMAAATKQAQVMKTAATKHVFQTAPVGTTGKWTRLLQTFTRPGVMAAAAALVVIGAVGTIYVTQGIDQGGDVQTTSARSSDLPSDMKAEAEAEESGAESNAAVAVAKRNSVDSAPSTNQNKVATLESEPIPAVAVAPKPARRATSKKPKSVDKEIPKPSKDGRRDSVASAEQQAGAIAPVAEASGDNAPAPRGAAPPPDSQVATLSQRLLQEVKRGNCDAAYATARRIKVASPEAHSKLIQSKALAACDQKFSGKKKPTVKE